MQNKVVIFGRNTKKVEEILLDRGVLEYIVCQDFDDCLSVCKSVYERSEEIVVLCNNDQIDSFVEKLKTQEDNLSLINDQAVKMERQTIFKKHFFVPIEGDFEKLLDQILPHREFYVSAIFGKSGTFLKEKLEQLKAVNGENFEFRIVEKTNFVHIVYHTSQIEESVFEGGVYSRKNESLAQRIVDVLGDKSVSIAEYMTGGALTAKVAKFSKKNIRSAEVFFDESGFEKIGISKLYLEQNDMVSKETVFDMAKNLLRNNASDLAIAVTGFDCDAGRSFVAIGNKGEIHVYSSVFYGARHEIVENVTDFALFKLVCFLKEKYQ